jgi:DNA damage-binding protein 1
MPSAVFFTNTGRIGVISAVPQALGYLFTSLERNLDYALPGPGGLEHAQYVKFTRILILHDIISLDASSWRAPVTVGAFGESSQTGFVDGDFVERFLDYEEPASAIIAMEGRNAAQKIDSNYVVVVQQLEQLQAVH